MNDISSYSDDESLTDATATSVLLGYANTQATSDDFSLLGGTPTWPSSKPPSASYASCKCCNNVMPLLLQLNADLPDRFIGHERRLYLFGCRRKACRRREGSMKGLRGVRKAARDSTPRATLQEPQQPEQSKQNMGATLFGASSISTSKSPIQSQPNPFASALAPASTLASKPPQKPSGTLDDLPQTFAEKVRISRPPESSSTSQEHYKSWPPIADLPKPYPSYYIDAETEYLMPSDSAKTDSSSTAYASFMDTTAPNGGGSKEDKVLYEDSHDKTFQRFADTLSQNSDHILRYEFGGQPLLYSRDDAVGRLFHRQHTENVKVTTNLIGSGIPRCQYCGSERLFELQLTPHAITELEAEEDAAVLLKEGMEWGTVLLGVCATDCAQDIGEGEWSWREEWVGVQWEEIVDRASSDGKGKGRA